MVVLKFAGYDSINDVEALRQYDILVNREDAVALEDGEFFICDVIGSKVYDQNDTEIGVIDDVLETPANHIFVIKKKGQDDLIEAGEKDHCSDQRIWIYRSDSFFCQFNGSPHICFLHIV